MPTYRVTLAYDGAPYHGFARQPDLPTVQGTIEEALGKVLGEPTETSVAGRTDAGVHALGQVISFRTSEPFEDLDGLVDRVNSMCGPTIVFLDAAPTQEGFDARFSAEARSYEYAILTRRAPDPFARHTSWHLPAPLDVDSMQKAAAALIGEHDFSTFGRVEEDRSPVRIVKSLEVAQDGQLVLVSITANSFIQQMVRSIVGTLVKVGQGKMGADEMASVLESKDRQSAGQVAPPHGLFLVSVTYPEDLL